MKYIGGYYEDIACESGIAPDILELEKCVEIRIEKGSAAADGAADCRGDAAQTR